MDLDGAKIEGHLNCVGGTFDKVILNATVVKKTLVWSQVKKTNGLDLRNASVGALADNEESWPDPGYLHLDGFQYERFTGMPVENSFGEEVSEEKYRELEKAYGKGTQDTPTDAGKRISWIARDIKVSPQPYRQLAKVLRDMGDDDGAKEVLLQMERKTRAQERQRLPMFQRLRDVGVDSIEDVTIGYGLYPLHAIYGLGAVCIFGWIIHRRALNIGAIAPTDKSAYEEFHKTGKVPLSYPPFSPLTYALENSVPFLRLGQDNRWEANPNPRTDAMLVF